MSQKLYAIVPAAGSGMRFGGPMPKQYLPLCGKTVIERSLNKLTPIVEKVIVAVADDDDFFGELACANDKKVQVVIGGQTRSESVANALSMLDINDDDWVLIHDAVRPLVDVQDVYRLIETLEAHPVGGLLAVPVNDTVKRANTEQEVSRTEDRSSLWLAQTPQIFRYSVLRESLAQLDSDLSLTDESLAVEKAGYPVKLVPGSTTNFKITRPEDMRMAELIVQSQEKTNK